MPFLGTENFYTRFDSSTYSRLLASFKLWAALEPKCSNQAFNVVNGKAESWQISSLSSPSASAARFLTIVHLRTYG